MNANIQHMLTPTELAGHLRGRAIIRKNLPIRNIQHDSRSCTPGSAYFAFPGLHHDGCSFIGDAINRGASLIVSPQAADADPRADHIILESGQIRQAYALASSLFYGNPSADTAVAGVTGTDGKTSTSYYLYQLLNGLGLRSALSTTVLVDDGRGLIRSPFHNTTPEAWDVQGMIRRSVESGCAGFVLEASSHALSTDYSRLLGTSFRLAIFTRITSEHLDFHKSWDAYAQSKLNLARMCSGPVVVYRDSPLLESLSRTVPSRLVVMDRPEITGTDREGLTFRYGHAQYRLPFPYPFALENAFAAAAAAALITGNGMDAVLERLRDLSNPPGRQEVLCIAGRTAVIDFAHTPDAISRLLSSFRSLYPDSRFITVFGASGERDRTKRPLMGRAASDESSLIVLTEDDSRDEDTQDICRQIATGITGADHLIITGRMAAVTEAARVSRPGDVIFLLGIGVQDTLTRQGKAEKWDERAAITAALEDLS